MNNEKTSQKSQFFQTLTLAWEFGYIIVIPLVALALIGRVLDNKFGSSPWLLITGIILSIIVSSVGLVMKFKKVLAAIEKAAKETEQTNVAQEKK